MEYNFELLAYHGGGMVSFYGGRIDLRYQTRLDYTENYADTALPDLDQPASDYFRQFHVGIAVSRTVPVHECARSFFDGDHVAFETAYPFGPGRSQARIASGLEAVDEIGGTTDHQLIGHGPEWTGIPYAARERIGALHPDSLRRWSNVL